VGTAASARPVTLSQSRVSTSECVKPLALFQGWWARVSERLGGGCVL